MHEIFSLLSSLALRTHLWRICFFRFAKIAKSMGEFIARMEFFRAMDNGNKENQLK